MAGRSRCSSASGEPPAIAGRGSPGWTGVARDGIHIGRYAIKLASLATDREHERSALETAIREIVGDEALRYTRGS